MAKLKETHKLDAMVVKALDRAMAASGDTANLLSVNNPRLANIKAQQTLADLKAAMRSLETNSDKKLAQSLNNAQKQVNGLVNSNLGQTGKARRTLQALRDKLVKHAQSQHRTGKQKNAETLAELAQKVDENIHNKNNIQSGGNGQGQQSEAKSSNDQDNRRRLKSQPPKNDGNNQATAGKYATTGGSSNNVDAGPTTGPDDLPVSTGKHTAEKLQLSTTNLRALQQLIAQLRFKNRQPSQIITAIVAKLRQQSRECKYLAKHPDVMGTAEKYQLLLDIEMEISDMQLALKRLTETVANSSSAVTDNKAKPMVDRDSPRETTGNIEQLNRLALTTISGLKSSCRVQEGRGSNSRQQLKKLHNTLHNVIKAATLILKKLKVVRVIYQFRPDEVPEKYRQDVADYFEKLSNYPTRD